ncbi:hypothetical protein NI18_19930 [Sphingomonas sp. Ant20]|nr:hypothetical protein NI18_19930 [Sphingomonas sp. Ant20]
MHARGLVLPKTAGWLKKLRGGKSYDRTTSATALLLLIVAQLTSTEIGKDRIAESDAAIFARTIEIIVVPCEDRRSTSFRMLDPGGSRPTPRIAATARNRPLAPPRRANQYLTRG